MKRSHNSYKKHFNFYHREKCWLAVENGCSPFSLMLTSQKQQLYLVSKFGHITTYWYIYPCGSCSAWNFNFPCMVHQHVSTSFSCHLSMCRTNNCGIFVISAIFIFLYFYLSFRCSSCVIRSVYKINDRFRRLDLSHLMKK